MSIENTNIANLRKNYEQHVLLEQNIPLNPFDQFAQWFNEALTRPVDEPNAMALATVSPDGFPQNRIVLLKGFSEEGFTFFTNYRSAKANDLVFNNKASLLFFYKEMERQIRIKGYVVKVSEEVSNEYFASRPKLSQIAAWASEQSKPITSRDVLDGRFDDLSRVYQASLVPKPPHWGGYCLQPEYFEFWQGRENRMHDRIVFKKTENGWERSRLSP